MKGGTSAITGEEDFAIPEDSEGRGEGLDEERGGEDGGEAAGEREGMIGGVDLVEEGFDGGGVAEVGFGEEEGVGFGEGDFSGEVGAEFVFEVGAEFVLDFGVEVVGDGDLIAEGVELFFGFGGEGRVVLHCGLLLRSKVVRYCEHISAMTSSPSFMRVWV